MQHPSRTSIIWGTDLILYAWNPGTTDHPKTTRTKHQQLQHLDWQPILVFTFHICFCSEPTTKTQFAETQAGRWSSQSHFAASTGTHEKSDCLLSSGCSRQSSSNDAHTHGDSCSHSFYQSITIYRMSIANYSLIIKHVYRHIMSHLSVHISPNLCIKRFKKNFPTTPFNLPCLCFSFSYKGQQPKQADPRPWLHGSANDIQRLGLPQAVGKLGKDVTHRRSKIIGPKMHGLKHLLNPFCKSGTHPSISVPRLLWLPCQTMERWAGSLGQHEKWYNNGPMGFWWCWFHVAYACWNALLVFRWVAFESFRQSIVFGFFCTILVYKHLQQDFEHLNDKINTQWETLVLQNPQLLSPSLSSSMRKRSASPWASSALRRFKTSCFPSQPYEVTWLWVVFS